MVLKVSKNELTMPLNQYERNVKFMKKVLVTGGTGYIGSHTVVELLNCHNPVHSPGRDPHRRGKILLQSP